MAGRYSSKSPLQQASLQLTCLSVRLSACLSTKQLLYLLLLLLLSLFYCSTSLFSHQIDEFKFLPTFLNLPEAAIQIQHHEHILTAHLETCKVAASSPSKLVIIKSHLLLLLLLTNHKTKFELNIRNYSKTDQRKNKKKKLQTQN